MVSACSVILPTQGNFIHVQEVLYLGAENGAGLRSEYWRATTLLGQFRCSLHAVGVEGGSIS